MLELQDVSRRYGDVVALDGVSFSVHQGQMRGLVGRNGAGKTTAMRIVLGLAEPDGGQVRLNGAVIDNAARRRIGYMPEERGLYPKMRVLDQLDFFGQLSGMPPADARTASRHWVERLGVADRAADRLDELSLGNQQRVQLAAALVHGPDLLVLDEPFSGLDPVGVDVLSAVLQEEVDRGAAVVFSSHQLELVEHLCDAVTILDRGRVVADGGIRELRMRHGGRRLRVELEGVSPGWADGLPGVAAVHPDGSGIVLELTDDADTDNVLDAARSAGRLAAFTPISPSLADLFREVVQP
ncbi:MAG TPA: ATP-binding cassette domain-containing protein [Acidimicrobiales bacterium]|nr:ATP-binding cassette domain-containing protein [Acidimicrobiales bacterium]